MTAPWMCGHGLPEGRASVDAGGPLRARRQGTPHDEAGDGAPHESGVEGAA